MLSTNALASEMMNKDDYIRSAVSSFNFSHFKIDDVMADFAGK